MADTYINGTVCMLKHIKLAATRVTVLDRAHMFQTSMFQKLD
jgi:hypothetical protein